MDFWQVILILAAGTAAGFINTLAGGGSALTIPILILAGLPSATANGTNRIAIMIQNMTAVANFKRKGFFDAKLSLQLGIPALLGAFLGSQIAVNIPDNIFNIILSVIMIFVLVIILVNPQKRLAEKVEGLTPKRRIIGMAAFFFVGIYGGFIQAGVGFIIITTLALVTGFTLVKINSLKVFIIAVYTIASLLVFILNGRVDWVLGLTLAAGNALGAFLGSNFAVSKGDKWIRVILIIAIVFMALKVSGLLSFLGL